MKAIATIVLCMTWALTIQAQNTIESIRKEYQNVQERIAHMMPDEDGNYAWPPEYYDLHVIQNLPATGPHHENIRMFYGKEEQEDEENYNPYPPHYLRFTTAKYNFAARQFYEEYLYDNKGQVIFIYAITPDVDENMTLYELRLWFDGKHLLRFTAKRAEGQEAYENLGKGTYKEVYTGKTIPELYRHETDRFLQRADRFKDMFKGIDNNTYL